MKDVFFHRAIALEMLLYDSVEHLLSYIVVPDALRINDQERSTITDPQTGSDTPFHALRVIISPQFTQFARQGLIEGSGTMVGITIFPETYEYVTVIRRLYGHMFLRHNMMADQECAPL